MALYTLVDRAIKKVWQGERRDKYSCHDNVVIVASKWPRRLIWSKDWNQWPKRFNMTSWPRIFDRGNKHDSIWAINFKFEVRSDSLFAGCSGLKTSFSLLPLHIILHFPQFSRNSIRFESERKKVVYSTNFGLCSNTLQNALQMVNLTSRQLFDKCWWVELGSLSLPDWIPRLS